MAKQASHSGRDKASSNSERKSYAIHALVGTIALITLMILLRSTVFEKPALIDGVDSADSTGATTTDATGEGTGTTATTPGAQPAPSPASTGATFEQESTPGVAAPFPSILRAPALPEKPAGLESISWAQSEFIPISVGEAAPEEGLPTGYTCVFSDRGAQLVVVRYETSAGDQRTPTWVRTPLDPMDPPHLGDASESLLLFGPWATNLTWHDPPDGSLAPVKDGLEKLNDPENMPRTGVDPRNGQTFAGVWDTTTRPFAFGFATRYGQNDWRNEVKWSVTRHAEADNNGGQRISFTSPADADGVVFTKHFTVYPGFKIVCEVEVKRAKREVVEGQPAPAPLVTRAMNFSNAPGIRQDLLHTGGAQDAGVAVWYSHPLGYAFEEEELHIASLPGEAQSWWEQRAENGLSKDWEIPLNDFFEPDEALNISIAGVSNGYFVTALGLDYLPANHYGNTWRGRVGSEVLLPAGFRQIREYATSTSLNFPALRLKEGESVSRRLVMYAGPRDSRYIERAFEIARPATAGIGGAPATPDPAMHWDNFLNTSWLPVLSEPISALLSWLYSLVGSAGIAVILLTVCIRMLMSPLSIKGQMSMQIHGSKMRKIKPKLDEVRAKYKDNKSREAQMLMFQETRAVMKNAGVSMLPLGGCLPLLLQFPIFIALYNSVRSSFLLRHESFLWIQDLSRPDALFGSMISDMWMLSANGFLTFNLLPLIWVALMVLQQRLQPKATDPQQAKMQKQMLFIMPVMGLFFYAMPAGFTLYFVASSIYSMIEIHSVKAYLYKKGLIERDPAAA